MPRDYYQVLGVQRGATDQEIKKAFRRLARELHPDVNREDPSASERFKEAAEAYEVLSDGERRELYDRYGHEGVRRGGWHPRSEDMGGVSDIFQAFFGDFFGGGHAAGPSPGGDVGAVVEVELDEVLTGATRQIAFEAAAPCERCGGEGGEPGTSVETCPTCGGAGEVRQVSRTAFGQMVRAGPCPTCQGRGRRPSSPCQECGGDGRVARERTWDLTVPQGIEDGQRIRVTGAGHAGMRGAPPGDLFVEVRVREHERLVRDGPHLLALVDVAATDAMVGGAVRVPTLEGEEEMEIEPGTQPGAQRVLRGRGLPDLRSGRRGELRVIFNVVVPVGLRGPQRELAEELARAITPANLEPEGRTGILDRLRRLLR